MTNLNEAIQLIKRGQKAEAQQALQGIIKSDPQNIQAWFWYVEACPTVEQRVQVLEMCLKANPGNSQVAQALQQFRSQIPESPVQPVVSQPEYPSQTHKYESEESSFASNNDLHDKASFQSSPYEEEKSSLAYALEKEYESFKIKPGQVSSASSWGQAGNTKYVDNSILSKSNKSARSYSTLDVWLTVLTAQDEKSYADILRDPEFGLGRAFTWMAYAGIVAALAVPVQLMFNPDVAQLMEIPELQNAFGSADSVALLLILTMIAVVIAPISSVINLALGGGVQNFIAMFFGGGGNYTRTVYAMAAFLAPMTIVTSLLAAIPVAGQCLAFPLSIYNLILNVRALKAAHGLSNGAAIGVVFAPGILAFIFVCLIVMATGASFTSS